MSRKLMMMAAALMAVAPARAATSTATMRLVAIVPVSCSIDLMNARIADRQLSLTLRRRCNTSHDIVFRAAGHGDLGVITLHYNQQAADLTDNYGSVAEPERYYDGFDHVVIQTTAGSDSDLRSYAQSLKIGIETT